jgi:hypothetical protein
MHRGIAAASGYPMVAMVIAEPGAVWRALLFEGRELREEELPRAGQGRRRGFLHTPPVVSRRAREPESPPNGARATSLKFRVLAQ